MATTSPARIDDDLYASAKLAGETQSRSASQQVAHWARIGREIEASSDISHREIAATLAGARTYDSLTVKEQAVVRAEWKAQMTSRREALDLAAKFTSAGRTWVELGDDGQVVERGLGADASATGAASAPRKAASPAKAARATGRAATRKAAAGATSTRTGVKATGVRASGRAHEPDRPAAAARSTGG